MKHFVLRNYGLSLVAVSLILLSLNANSQDRGNFVGGIDDKDSAAQDAITVRNNVAQASTPIVTQRYFKIKKGSFPDFLKASQEGVWPYFEKIGSRVIGMWLVTHPAATGTQETKDYDEAILMTQYASVEHWQATRQMTSLGGNGPDWEKCQEAIAFRRTLTLETSLMFLEGSTWQNPPYFMPGVKN